MTLTAFWTGVVPVVYFVSLPLVAVFVVVFVVAICRQATEGDAVLSEREVAAGQRPRGDVAVQPLTDTIGESIFGAPWADRERIRVEVKSLNVVRGRDGLARVDLDALDRAIDRELAVGDRSTRVDLLCEAAWALRGYADLFTTAANAATGVRLRELASVVESEVGAR
jgi:hypothetical protein